MNKYISLVKVLLKTSNENLTSSKKRYKTIALYGIILLALIPFMFSVGKITGHLYDALAGMDQQGTILALALALTSLSIMVFGVLYVVNVFYFASDIEYLLPLPLKPSLILSGKFTVTVIYEYIIEVMFLLPIFIQYGIKSGGGILYYIYAIVIFLITPIVPLIVSSVIVIIIMRFTNIAKNKDRFKVISGFISIFIAIGFNLGVQKLTGRNNVDIQKIIMSGDNSYINVISNIFPTAKFSSMALANSFSSKGFLYFMLFLGINILLYILFLYLGEKVYFKGVVGLTQSQSKRKKYKAHELSKILISKSPLISYTMKEIKMLVRTPIFFLNCVATNFLWPIFLIFPMILQPEAREAMPMISDILANSDNLGVILGWVAAASLFIASANGIASSSISREGKNVYFNKYIPISYMTIVMSKILSSMVFSFIGVILVLGVLGVVLGLGVKIILLSLAISVFGIVLSSIIGIVIDLNFPKLNWDSEQKAVKQNLNVVIGMGISIAMAFITIKTISAFRLNGPTVVGFIVILYFTISLLFYIYLKRNLDKLFEQMED
ncbi:ABC transporter permease [Clostridium malenominatum]|uniref:ABC transporter permease n=1 Tax=Clostridium malenominatum TaxID=1539 RepID=A0ABP3UAN4_9CLOT